jgi:MtrB/PioB family decaheme-associated outer membrane protein
MDDVMVQRDRVGAEFNWVGVQNWKFTAGADFEHREGVRPMWGSFGFSNTVELLQPVNYDSWTFRTGVSYGAEPWTVGVFYTASFFENHDDSLVWDNPFRNVNATAANAYAVLNTSGAREGRLAAAADNSMHEISVRAGYNLSPEARLDATASWSWRFSSVDLQPYTINTAIVTGAAANVGTAPFNAFDPANLPASDFNGEMFIQSYGLALSWRPISIVDTKFYGRFYELDDRRDEIEFPGYVRADATWLNAPAENELLSYDRWSAGVTNTIRVAALSSKIKPSYEYTQWDRENRNVGKVTEHSVGLGYDTQWTDGITTKIGAGFARREGSAYKPLDPAVLTFMRMFDQSDRDRLRGSAEVDVALSENVEASLRYQVTYDDYDSHFGVRDSAWHEASVDVVVKVSEAFDCTAFFAWDRYELRQKGRQWAPGGIGDPATPAAAAEENPNNWISDTVDQVYTVGLRPRWIIVKDKADASLQATYVFNRADIDLSSPVGAAAADLNNFEPGDLRPSEYAERVSLQLRVTIAVDEHARFVIGYEMDYLFSSQFGQEGLSPVPTTPAGAYAGAYPLRLSYPDSTLHIGYIGLSLRY